MACFLSTCWHSSHCGNHRSPSFGSTVHDLSAQTVNQTCHVLVGPYGVVDDPVHAQGLGIGLGIDQAIKEYELVTKEGPSSSYCSYEVKEHRTVLASMYRGRDL